MFSLYRAWLSLTPCQTTPPLPAPIQPATPLNLTSTPTSPDTTLQVGPNLTQFSAHRNILSLHSGFFKAALSNHTPGTPILVPNVNVDEFSSLLTFMYTGYLDLNLSNIYSTLLATHILHMPRALELCRSFLLQAQPPTPRTNVIKPIVLKAPPTDPNHFFHISSGSLPKSSDTLFKTVGAPEPPEPKEKEQKEKDRTKKKRKLESSEKVIIDIACCDGPVRFHRVINKNYGMQVDHAETQEVKNKNAVLNKVMNENIQNVLENQTENELFTCLYCNHTFKSQYCYQKHARRHLNPVDPKAQKEVKREVKPLDMNVQYYPCKTCGGKFPSYYFVHKHRKLCHAEEMAESSNKNNEMKPSKAEPEVESNSSESAIDVVNGEN